MADLTLGQGVTVVIEPPDVPTFVTEPPPATDLVILPVGGPQGPPGPAGVRYTFVQPTPASTWTIHHGLNAYPNFLLFTAEDPHVPVFTDITYPDADTAVVEWPTPQSGHAES